MPSERVQRQTDRLVDEAEVAEVARDWAKVRGVIEWNRNMIDEFRANAGKVNQFDQVLLLTTTGRRSGRPYTTPVVYAQDGDRYLIFASKAGADTNPDWYHNLVATPRVTIELGTDKFAANATVTQGEERDRLYATQAARQPQFAEYQSKTKRLIPVVALTRVS